MAALLASNVIRKLEQLVLVYGNRPVEIDTDGNLGIAPAQKVKVQESDSERGDTFIISA